MERDSGNFAAVVLADFSQQFIHIVLRKILPPPFLIVERLAGNQSEKAQSIDRT